MPHTPLHTSEQDLFNLPFSLQNANIIGGGRGGLNPLSAGVGTAGAVAGKINPLFAALGVGLQGVSSLFPSQAKRDKRFSSSKLRELFGSETASQFEGIDIDELLRQFELSLNLPQLRSNLSQGSGINSLESNVLLNNALTRARGGRTGELQELEAQLGFSFDQSKKNRLVNILNSLRE